MDYRRANTPGGTYFFTVNLADRGADTLVLYIEVLRAATTAVKPGDPYTLLAMIVLPEHLHARWGVVGLRWLSQPTRIRDLATAHASNRHARGRKRDLERHPSRYSNQRSVWQALPASQSTSSLLRVMEQPKLHHQPETFGSVSHPIGLCTETGSHYDRIAQIFGD